MGFVAGMGFAILLIFTLLLATLIGLYEFAFLGHSYLVILEQTAAGLDEVQWPDEPVFDWCFRPFFLIYLSGFWAALAWIGLAIATPGWVLHPLAFGTLMLVTVWLLFPVSLLSALGANCWYMLLYRPFLRRLRRRLGHLLLLYLLTAPLVFGSVALVFLALSRGLALLLLAAVALPACVFLHARLLGRLGWLIGERTPLTTRKKRAKPLPVLPRPDSGQPPAQLPEPPSPSSSGASEEEEEDEWAPNKKPYATLSAEEAQRSWRSRPKPGQAELEPGYDLASQGQPIPPPPLESYLPTKPGNPLEPLPSATLEGRLAASVPKVTEPALLFWSGILAFLVYPRTLRPLMVLALVTALELGLVQTMIWLLER